jgi:hypothetical protein
MRLDELIGLDELMRLELMRLEELMKHQSRESQKKDRRNGKMEDDRL